MPIPVLPPYDAPFMPVPQVTPFTYRDGVTMLQKLRNIGTYINKVLVPFVNENYEDLAEAFETQANYLIEQVNAAIEAVIGSSVEVQDTVVAAIFGNEDSETRLVTDLLYGKQEDIDELTDIINTGRLSETYLDNRYTLKTDFTTYKNIIDTGRLSETSLDGDYGSKTDVDNLKTLTTSGRLSEASLDLEYAQSSDLDTVENIINSGRLSVTAMNDMVAGMVSGDTTRKYKVVALALRNDGTGWAPLSDSAHRSTGVDSVSQTSTYVRVDYTSLGATRVVGFICSPDEAFAGVLDFGASVGLTYADISLQRRKPLSSAISWNGSAWVSSNALMGVDASDIANGNIKVNHPGITVDGTLGGDALDVSLAPREGVSNSYYYRIGGNGVGVDWVEVCIRNQSGTKITAADTNCKFLISRGPIRTTLDPTTVTTTTYPNANIWVLGIFEVA